MKTTLLEVFIEPGCKACVSVMHSIRKVQSDLNIEVKVYRRDTEPDVFKKRNVVITPAIFINNVLMFYGEVTPVEIEKKLYQVNRI